MVVVVCDFYSTCAAVFDQIFDSYRIRAVLNDLCFSPSKDEPFSPVFL